MNNMVKYNAIKARKLLLNHLSPLEGDTLKCGNPFCDTIVKIKSMELHHIWVRSNKKVDPYDVNNMVFICTKCHTAQHKGWNILYAKKKH